MTRTLACSILVILLVPGTLHAGEMLYLTRTLELNFRHPGRITKVAEEGKPPVEETLRPHSYEIILPKRVKLVLSIMGDNEDEHRYHIRVKIDDDGENTGSVEDVITPDKAGKDLWLERYHYQLTLLNKSSTARNYFISARVKLDVYAPGPK